ncbi:substrate-binding periplasmic protein [Pseudoalteromonas mariniglutinosa]|uniref:substrate-binding periplasmic protein n=1 Tax=Pseudoalteromonas mariniglutinosa TaxID=206042 RepID=UPI00384B44C9
MKQAILGMVLLFCFEVQAYDKLISSQRVSIAASSYLPPYVMADQDSGIQLDILKAALRQQGITHFDIRYMSNKRAEKQLQVGEVDIALNYAGYLDGQIFPSNSLLDYQNVAISLTQKNLKIDTPYDLIGKSVLAFQNATAFLGQPFKSLTTKLLSYDEVVNQAAQIDHLMKNWVDVIILERRVFFYYLNEYEKKQPSLPIQIHTIFAEVARPAYFNNAALKDTFNAGLEKIKDSGEYHAIISLDGTEYADLVPNNF